MKQANNIYLIGLMGAGKTTMGKKLAQALQWPFYDSDRVIEETTGVSIPMIFEYEGEEGFRDREQEIISYLTGLDQIVMATGGGAILRPENRQKLQQNGFVVYLECSIERILQRTRRDTQRPLLQTENPRQRLEQLLQEREPLYRECADFSVDTGIMQSKAALKAILTEFKKYR
ncbi:shikimate kinase AroK [methane-oxidizing endosymbiont of Gigantopelta aegis]|uniref:shikimate kinase AroK n=1 Tax=methane-oxidizing endosymbiont of Gigantopelta aegis TaxID=2794938 RepID=UPI0018DEC113|nr:shikimate kinase AroK [methane-oxidizing endosymbiont of Gigantopelta aegis]